MTMAASTTLPTLSQIHGWDVSHLEAAADAWAVRAAAWEGCYSAVFQQTFHPGGTSWQGAAADAAAQRVGADRRVVIGAADLLTTAAAAARAGAVDIRTAKQVALHKIGMARSAGFDVEEDLSIVEVTTPSPATRHQREALAVTHARRVWNSADTLAATDREAARKITQAVEGLGDLTFPTDPDQRWPGAMMADYAGVAGPLPAAPHLIYCYPSARPDFWWCEGYDIGGGPYGFDSPIDVSGVG